MLVTGSPHLIDMASSENADSELFVAFGKLTIKGLECNGGKCVSFFYAIVTLCVLFVVLEAMDAVDILVSKSDRSVRGANLPKYEVSVGIDILDPSNIVITSAGSQSHVYQRGLLNLKKEEFVSEKKD